MQNKCISNNILETCNTVHDFLKGKALIIFWILHFSSKQNGYY